jgi:hypothetical protein
MREEHAYYTPESVAKKDAEMMARVETAGDKLKEGIKKMRETMRAKYKTCTPDQEFYTYPYVVDLGTKEVLIVPTMCDKGKERYVVVSCDLYHGKPNDVSYNIRISGNKYMTSADGTLEDAMKKVEEVIFGKTW